MKFAFGGNSFGNLHESSYNDFTHFKIIKIKNKMIRFMAEVENHFNCVQVKEMKK
jgi:hypothetical protein